MAFAKLFIIIGSVSAGLTVAIGAFGAHILKNKLSAEMLQRYKI